MIRTTILVPVLAVLALSACNMMAGAGRDLQNAGWTLQSEATRAGTPGEAPANPTPQPVQ